VSAGGARGPEVVVATSNPGKLREIRQLLEGLPVELCALDAFPDVEMPVEGDDYAANALAKARSVARATGRVAIADDSGLEVEGLGGRPGPRSARYGGEGLDDAARVAHLLHEMTGLEAAARAARFVCVAAVAAPDGEAATARGECDGRILDAPRGRQGFGYDPVFLAREAGVAMAELPERDKNRISHRARALRALRDEILRLARPAAG
jgi:XTP/dITP diphosphohydrolase